MVAAPGEGMEARMNCEGLKGIFWGDGDGLHPDRGLSCLGLEMGKQCLVAHLTFMWFVACVESKVSMASLIALNLVSHSLPSALS